MLKTLALGATLIASANAAHLTPEAAKIWTEVGRANPMELKGFTVGMPMKDFPLLERTLDEVSNPKSKRYGQWLSKEEADAIAATPENIAAEVKKWATSTGAHCERKPEAFSCTGTVKSIERLLNGELSTYVNKQNGEKIIRTSMNKPGSIPTSLAGKVTVLTGLTQLPLGDYRAGKMRPFASYTAGADYSIVPETLNKLYQHEGADESANSQSGPIEFQNYPAILRSDNDAFATSVGISKWTIPANQTIGTFAPQPAAESALDEQYLVAMSPLASKWYWTVADWQFEFANQVLSMTNAQVPSVMSISYAWYELDQCDISPGVAPCTGVPVPAGSAAFVSAVNQLFAKIGARGISLLSASGDSGAHGRTDSGCTDPKTRPDYPAASPYVTAVGATELSGGTTGTAFKAPICKSTLKCADGGTEVVASRKTISFFSSGGGFSTLTPQPAWQKAVVAKYLASGAFLPGPNDFNKSNYAFPVLSALGHNYYVEIGGAVQAVDGTSAATPVISGLITALNGWRIANGKPLLGYLNPLLYQIYDTNPAAFNDVTSGDNACTEGACPCPAKTGFGAAVGYDAVTGLGTPNYDTIKATITALGI